MSTLSRTKVFLDADATRRRSWRQEWGRGNRGWDERGEVKTNPFEVIFLDSILVGGSDSNDGVRSEKGYRTL